MCVALLLLLFCSKALGFIDVYNLFKMNYCFIVLVMYSILKIGVAYAFLFYTFFPVFVFHLFV